MTEIYDDKHSKLGIASFLLAIATSLYLFLLIWSFFYTKIVPKVLNDIFPNEFGATLFVLLFYIFLFIGLPLAGYLTGLIFGISGTVQKKKKRSFALIGIVLSVLPILAATIYFMFIFK